MRSHRALTLRVLSWTAVAGTAIRVAAIALLAIGMLGRSPAVAQQATPAPGADPSQGEGPSVLDPQWDLDRFSWSGRLAEGASLRLINEFGDIRTRASGDDQVDVSAVIQKRRDLEAEPDVAIIESDGLLTVEVRFPAAAIDRALLQPGTPPDRRVDIVVFVPPGAELEARTVRGLLEAKGLSGNAELRSDSGDVVVHTAASATARTEHGSITAVFGERTWTRAPRLETLTGDIYVELPKQIDVVASISTRAHITSDYSIAIERQGLLRTAEAVIGTGGQELFIDTNKGEVRLLESIR